MAPPNKPQEPASAAAALAAQRHRRWPDMLPRTAVLIVGLCCGGCATQVTTADLADRLAVLSKRSTVFPESREETLARLARPAPFGGPQPDVRGTVALVVDDRVAVRLDGDSQPVPSDEPCSMAIFTERTYKAEMAVVETFRGHALGWIILQKSAAQIGDRAGCRTP